MADNGPEGKNDDANGGNDPPAEQHSFVEAIQSFKREYRCAQQGRANHEQKTLFWTRVAGFGVWFYSIITAVIMGAGIYSAIQAKNSADAAIAAAKISSDTEIRQLRAYLYVRRYPIAVSPTTASAIIEIDHAGATPAYNIRLDADIMANQYLVGKLQLPDVTAQNVSHVLQHQYSILYSTEHIQEAVTMPPWATEAMKLALTPNSNYRFYIYGVVRYFDIFGLDKLQPERRYKFCFIYEPKTGDMGTERGCEDYNKPG